MSMGAFWTSLEGPFVELFGESFCFASPKTLWRSASLRCLGVLWEIESDRGNTQQLKGLVLFFFEQNTRKGF